MTEEAIAHIRYALDFAYKHGLHEFGYDPLATLTAALPDLKAERDALVEKMARAMLALRVARTDETWTRYRQSNSWKLFEDDARAALRALQSGAAGEVG